MLHSFMLYRAARTAYDIDYIQKLSSQPEAERFFSGIY